MIVDTLLAGLRIDEGDFVVLAVEIETVADLRCDLLETGILRRFRMRVRVDLLAIDDRTSVDDRFDALFAVAALGPLGHHRFHFVGLVTEVLEDDRVLAGLVIGVHAARTIAFTRV